MSSVLEHALLPVITGRESAFEATLPEALAIIRSAPGCLGARVSRCVEEPRHYLLLVHWRRLEDHDPGFRDSAEYQEWSRLLHRFYEPFPDVRHFRDTGL